MPPLLFCIQDQIQIEPYRGWNFFGFSCFLPELHYSNRTVSGLKLIWWSRSDHLLSIQIEPYRGWNLRASAVIPAFVSIQIEPYRGWNSLIRQSLSLSTKFIQIEPYRGWNKNWLLRSKILTSIQIEPYRGWNPSGSPRNTASPIIFKSNRIGVETYWRNWKIPSQVHSNRTVSGLKLDVPVVRIALCHSNRTVSGLKLNSVFGFSRFPYLSQ